MAVGLAALGAAAGGVVVGVVGVKAAEWVWLLAPSHRTCDLGELPPDAPPVRVVEHCEFGCWVEVEVGDGDAPERLVFGDDSLCQDVDVRWSGVAVIVKARGRTEIVPDRAP